MTSVGVVTIAHGRHDHLRGQHTSLARSARRPDLYVVVAMDDPELEAWPAIEGLAARVVPMDVPRQGLPLAAARNRGIELAVAEGCDVVVCLDVDCLAGPELVGAYERAVVEEPELLWSGPVTYLDPPPTDGYRLDALDELDHPHPSRPAPQPGERIRGGDPHLFWSLSFAISASNWADIGGFCEDYVGYGAEDTDFAHQADARGIRLGWDGSARAYRQYHPRSDPPVEHLDDIMRNGRIFRDRWGRWPMVGCLSELEDCGFVVRRGMDWFRANRGVRSGPTRPRR